MNSTDGFMPDGNDMGAEHAVSFWLTEWPSESGVELRHHVKMLYGGPGGTLVFAVGQGGKELAGLCLKIENGRLRVEVYPDNNHEEGCYHSAPRFEHELAVLAALEAKSSPDEGGEQEA